MKKIVLIAVLISLFTTPCLAQIETNSLFSLNGTSWIFPGVYGYVLGFYEGDIYLCDEGDCPSPSIYPSIIKDLLIISIFSIDTNGGTSLSGFASPLIGVGWCKICADYICVPSLITKTSDKFYPSFLSVNNGQLEGFNEMIDGVLGLIDEETE